MSIIPIFYTYFIDFSQRDWGMSRRLTIQAPYSTIFSADQHE
jgi:hypothetical protein